MWTIEHTIGRLVEVRVASPVVAADVESFGQRMVSLLYRFQPPSPRVIACADLSAANLFAPEVAEAFIRVMQRDNSLLERSAFLIGDSAMFALQVERMLKQSSSPLRRAFRDPAPLFGWLSESLLPPEQERLRRFLADAAPKKT